MHGYDVYGDLAQHYRASDLALTGLVGHPPSEQEGALFDATLSFLAPCTVSEAPSHAAVLTRACGGAAPQLVSVGATLLAEHSEALVRDHASLLAWLSASGGPLPPPFRCGDEAARQGVRLFEARLGRAGIELTIFAHDPTLDAACIAALHRCGLTDPEQLVAALVLARLPGVLAESLAAPIGDRRPYPIDLPPFRYVADEPPEPAP